jgi:hypothetical protein
MFLGGKGSIFLTNSIEKKTTTKIPTTLPIFRRVSTIGGRGMLPCPPGDNDNLRKKGGSAEKRKNPIRVDIVD